MAEDKNPFATGNTYVEPGTDLDLPEANLSYAPAKGSLAAKQLEPFSNFQQSQQNLLDATNIQTPSPLMTSKELADSVNNGSILSNLANPVQNLNQPLLTKAVLDTQAPLNAADSAQISAPQYVEPVAQSVPQAAEAAPQSSQIDSIVNPFGGSNSMGMKAIGQAEQAGVLKAAAEHSYFQKKADVEQEAMDNQQKLQETFDFNYQEKMDDYTQSIKDFRALAGEKIIPGAFLARQDTQGSLMTGLAVALGGIGGALQGTNKNIGLEMIEKAIDKDVAAQQFNLEYKYKVGKTNVDDQSSLLNKMREKFGDEKSAIVATKLGMLSMVQDKMNSEITKKGGASELQSKAQANTARAAIMQRREALEMQLKAAQAQQFEKKQMMQGVDYYNMSNEQANLHLGKDANKYVRGYGTSTDPQLAKDFIQKVKPMGDTIRKLKDTMTSIDKLSKWNYNDRQAMESIMTDLQLTLKDEENYKLGVLTGPDMDLLQKVTGDPNSFSPIVNSKARLMQTLKNMEAKMDNKIENYGFVPHNKRPGGVDSLVKKNK